MALTVGVLVTNYNSWNIALSCVDAHLRLCGPRLSRVLLIDDCSTQPPPQTIDARVTVVRNETNLGLVKSLNKGIQLLNTDIVVLFDADAKPLNDYFDDVVNAFSSDTTLALLGFRTVDENNNPTASSDVEPGLSSLLLGQAMYAQYQKFQNKSRHNLSIYTCSMAVRKEAFDDLGGFDEQFDWLDLDHDFSMRVNRSQWSLAIATRLIAFHKGGGSPQVTSRRVLRFYQNRWYLLRKFDKVKYPGLAKFIVLTRLKAEYLLLCAASRMLFKDENVRHDKIRGRRKIIQFCRDHY